MRGFAGVISILLLAHAPPLQAQTCPCGPMPTVADAQHAAIAVFEGRVQKLSFLKSEPPSVQAEFAVVRAWKGMSDERAIVVSPPDGVPQDVHATCTYAFEPGESYLVYALGRGTDGQLQVSACGRTRPIEQAGEDLARLGMGSAPVVPQKAPALAATTGTPEEPPARGGCASCSALGAHAGSRGGSTLPALLVVGCVIGSTVLRRRRRPVRRRLSP